ncbi:hypothetical protein O3G_MSEX014119 [Manduca sexta]|uniref:Translation initiation factor eIF-2B subunit beta n=1 Tax=Manduca sexta TaxID=7130 RepID=A0A922CZ76_MANSE|nr:hypothetical protein O3G_MSEX014119 [Manduca sexta]
MSPLESPVKELDEKFLEAVGKFVANVKNGKIDGSHNIAVATVTLLEQIISDSPHATAYELSSTLRAVGRHLRDVLPLQLVAGNMVRRVLRAVRDEARAAANQDGEGAGESLQRLVLAAPSRRATFGPDHQDLREPLRDHIAELRAELESTVSSVCAQARAHVRAELVLARGGGGAAGAALLERFLRLAAHDKYTLLLAESTDVHESHAMASRLAAAGVSVTVIPTAAVYAVMSRVNKVVVSVSAALGGGAALGEAGLLAVTSAAKYHNVPVSHTSAPVHYTYVLHN